MLLFLLFDFLSLVFSIDYPLYKKKIHFSFLTLNTTIYRYSSYQIFFQI